MLSASDPNQRCLEFVTENYPDSFPTHWFDTLEAQCKKGPAKACLRHPFAADGCDPCPVGRGNVDFAISGSPCHPFSMQRGNRFEDIVGHHEYDTTMSSLLDWALFFEPKSWVMEQVQGFDKPFKKDDPDPTNTPYRRLAAQSVFCFEQGLGVSGVQGLGSEPSEL